MIIEELIEERKHLQNVIDEAACRIPKYPDGSLIKTVVNKKYLQYYSALKGKKFYLSKRKRIEFIKSLAEKKQDLMILEILPKQVKAIDQFIEVFNPSALDEILCKGRELCAEFAELPVNDFPEKEIVKSVPDASTEDSNTADGTDLARNLIAICSAFLQAKGC